MNPSGKLRELGIELPEPAKPVASYVTSIRTGNHIFTRSSVLLQPWPVGRGRGVGDS